jgi:hypothetical protein
MSPYWPLFGHKLARYGFTETIASDFFKENSDPFSFNALFTSTNTEVSQWYDCQEPDRCNSHELAVKQWANSTVTMNPPDLIRQFYPQAISVKDWQQGWFLEVYEIPFEFNAFVVNREITNYESITVESANKMLGYDRLFAGSLVAKSIVDLKSGSHDTVVNEMFWANWKIFEQYVNFIMLDGVMGGFTLNLTVGQWAAGIGTRFAQHWVQQNTARGFDPSLVPDVHQLSMNNTYRLTKYTGSGDNGMMQNTGKLAMVDGNDKIQAEYSYFDGNETFVGQRSPWREPTSLDDLSLATGPQGINPNAKTPKWNLSIYDFYSHKP